MEVATMALQQHLNHPGNCAKISVNLEGWVSIKQVRIHAALLSIVHSARFDQRE